MNSLPGSGVKAEVPPSDTYEYLPLESSTAIRLLTVRRGAKDEPIVCSLTIVDLANRPIYEALSYCWGSEQDPKNILLGVHEVKIRENLWSALSHLRKDWKERVLWADALCINQNDLSERNSQVRLMKDIYRNSSRVIAWLGPSADDSDKAMIQLSRNPTALSLDREASLSEYNLLPEDRRSLHLRSEWANEQSALVVKAVGALCEREYWYRMWILQECYHAKSLYIHCGSKFVPAAAFLNIPTYIIAIEANSAFQILDLGLHLKKLDLLDYIDQLIDRDCTDPKDAVYALLSMTYSEGNIPIDYSKELIDVFCDVLELYANGEPRGQGAFKYTPAELYTDDGMENFLILLFAQVLKWLCRIESKHYCRASMPGVENKIWPLSNAEDSQWSHTRKTNEIYPPKPDETGYELAQTSLMSRFLGEDGPDRVVEWLTKDTKTGMTCDLYWHEAWVHKFPSAIRRFSQLQLFAVTLGRYKALKMDLSGNEIVLTMRYPATSNLIITMQRATGTLTVRNHTTIP